MSYRLVPPPTHAGAPGSRSGLRLVFNDMLWTLNMPRTDAEFPITASLLNLEGAYTAFWNVVAAGALIAAVPTAIVLFAFQRHFVFGLLVGANK